MTFCERAGQAARVAATVLMAVAAFYPTSSPLAQGARTQAPVADAAVAGGMGDNGVAHELLLDMQQMHLTGCATRVQQVMTFLFDGQDARFIAEPLGPDSDRWPAVFVIESAAPPGGGHSRLSTLMISPGCAGMYEQVIYWSQPCQTVRSTIFAKFAGDRLLLHDVKVSSDGPAVNVYLAPAGAGCMSVKKELFR